MKPEMLYCLTCERWVPVVNGGHIIYECAWDNDPEEVDFCDGPFTANEPYDHDDLPVDEPDYDELERINEDAINFMEVE